MDPLSIHATQLATLRPVAALPLELAAVLRQGQVLAGQVLQTFAGGSLLIGVGRHRVPARSQVELPAGKRFFFRVEQDEGEVVLRVLQEGESRETPLLRALRASPGWERPYAQALADLGRSLEAGTRDPRLPAALRQLAAHLPEHSVDEHLDAGALKARLARSGFFLERHVAELVLAEARPSERQALAELLSRGVDSSKPGLLGLVLQLLSPRGEAGAARSDASAALQATASSLQADFKALLLATLAELPEGAQRESVQRVLAALELEQLLNVARSLEGEPQQWSLILRDHDAWSLLQLRYEPSKQDDAHAGAAANDKVQRLSLALELRSTGPVRVDLVLRERGLSARVRVVSEDVAARLGARLQELEQALARGGRSASVALVVEPSERLELERTHALGILREHPLLDRLG